MKPWLLGVLVTIAILGLATVYGLGMARLDEAGADVDRTTNSSLNGGVVELNGRTYNCITYTKEGRGGIWCERVAP